MGSEWTYLILVRHGETPWTHEKRLQGWTDTSLTTRGRGQARAAAKALKHFKPDVLYSSKLKRAVETGEILANTLKLKRHSDSRLNEYGFGPWEGRTVVSLVADNDPVYREWLKGTWTAPEGAEKLTVFRKRLKSLLNDVIKKHRGKKIVLVSHGAAIRMIFFSLIPFAKEDFWSFRVDPASISILGVHPKRVQIVRINDCSHDAPGVLS